MVLEKSDRLGGRLEDIDLRKLAQPLYGECRFSLGVPGCSKGFVAYRVILVGAYLRWIDCDIVILLSA